MREGAGVASAGDTAVLFGGLYTSFVSETWTWNGAAWTQVATVTAPSAREYVALVRFDDEVLLFGGFAGFASLTDTWTWSGAQWTQVNVPGPTPRTFEATTQFNDTVVLFRW